MEPRIRYHDNTKKKEDANQNSINYCLSSHFAPPPRASRILELLRLTDPDRTAATRAAGTAGLGTGGAAERTARGIEDRWRDGEEEEGDRVSEELIEQLEERVAEAEVR